MFENKAVVDAHGVYYAPACTLYRYARVYAYTQRGFLHCLFDITGFSYDLKKRISKRRDPRFLMLGTEPVIHSSHLNNDLAYAGELLRWDFLYNCLIVD